MAAPYEELIQTGFIGSLKRDILLSATDDIKYLCHIRRNFEQSSAAAAEQATTCTARIAQELISKGLCNLATWKKSNQGYDVVEKTSDELREIADNYTGHDSSCFNYFLVATDRGKEWVDRYRRLVREL